MGDEVMAVFDGPEKEMNACMASLEIVRAMQEERKRREKAGEHIVEIGIGINSGEAVFGSMGARERMDFTCIGDNVNIAARLEGANKAYKSKSLITESVYKKVQTKFLCREIDFMTVKGKKEPVRIYEVLQEKGAADRKDLEKYELFEKGLRFYRAMRWDDAMTAFQTLIDKYQDGPAEVFYKRSSLFKKDPPPIDWNGVYNLTVK